MKKITVSAAITILVFGLANITLAQIHPFTDAFTDTSLAQWWRGANSTSAYVKVVSPNILELQSQPNQSGWLISKNNYILRNSTVTLKVVTANKDGDLGISPTYNLADQRGIDAQPNWYRFYVGPNSSNQAPPYWLYVYKKNDGTKASLDSVGNLSNPFHIRMRFDDCKIYFEYSTNGSTWILLYDEFFDLPGYMLDDRFYYEIAATNTAANGKLQVDDFATAQNTSTTEKEILVDSLKSSSFVNGANDPNQSLRVDRFNVGSNSNFSTSGWKPTADSNLVKYDLGRYLKNGSLEITVTQFEPKSQNKMKRHHVLAMFRMPWGSHHVVEDLETDWDLHTGFQYSQNNHSGVKLYSVTHFYDQTHYDEKQSITPLHNEDYAPQYDWNRSTQYTIKMVWSDKSVAYYRNKVLQKSENIPLGPIFDIVHSHTKDFELRYVYVGRDRTVSGDTATSYNGEYGTNGNQYRAMWSNGQSGSPIGPIYSNIKVKQIVSATDMTSPTISAISHITFANGGRLSWTTNELATCYVNYGTTTSYGSKTTVLGPPTKNHSTALAGLASNQTYHYQIITVDSAGNKTVSANQTFKTQQAGVYIFKPVADTYIERNKNGGIYSHLYGTARASGNYGWMNLMTAKGRIGYLKFNVTGVTGTFNQATVQLYGRQGGNGDIRLKTFTPKPGHESDWEFNLTWNNQSTYIQSLNAQIANLSLVTAGQWHPMNVSTVVQNNNTYYFALHDTSGIDPISFDSRESTNNQPELIISATQPAFAEVTKINNLPGIADGDVAWGDYDKNERLDLVITGLGTSDLPVSKIFRNINDSTFTEISTSLVQLKSSAADWGDFDMDNDLDLLLAGQPSSGNPVTKVYQYQNGNFAEKTTTLSGVKYGDVAWGNYNHDQYLDILLSGEGISASFATKVYRGASSGGIRNWNVDASFNLPQLKYSSVAWGDNDLDGWLDLLVAGIDSNSVNKIEIYRSNLKNDDGFVIASILPPQVMTASVAWGNFEGQNYLDLAFAGRTNTTTQVYQRTGSTYVPVDTAALADVKQGTVAWGDYDNDGDLDLLVTGEKSSPTARISKVYRNDAYQANVRKFVDIGAPLDGVQNGAAAWGDYDNDGDLDILLAGNKNSSGPTGRIAKVYKNTLNVPNDPPTVPTNLDVVYSSADSAYILKWAQSTDDRTPTATLTYNVMIGTKSGWNDVVSPMSKIANGKRFLAAPGNAGAKDYYVFNRRGLENVTYYWKVQAVDNVWAGSAFSAVDSFTVGITKTAETDSTTDSDSTAIAQAIPKSFALSQNYPNPFNPTTRLNLDLPENGRVKAIVYNLTGQEVARLQDGAMTAGYRHLNWDGRNKFGANVSSGFYLVKVVFEGVSGLRKESTSRVVLLK